jgi:hypothetical protein
MFARGSRSSESRLRNQNASEVRVTSEFHYGRPIPSVWRDTVDRQETRQNRSRTSEEDGSGLASSFPLIFFGAGLTFVGFYIRSEDPSAFIARLPLWIPFLLLGLIGLGGGILSVFAKPTEVTGIRRPDESARESGPSLGRDLPPIRARRSPPTARRFEETATPTSSPVRAAHADRPRSTEFALTPRPGESERARASRTGAQLDFASLFQELESIDLELRGAPARRPPSPPRSRADTGTDSVGRPTGPAPERESGPTVEVSSLPRTALEPLASEPTRLAMDCIGCGSAITRFPPSAVCRGCDQPLCAECLGRSEADGEPVLCPFCTALNSLHVGEPRATSAPRDRSLSGR